MPYKVTAKQLVDVTHECPSREAAHAKAMELEATGHIDVQILDPSGQDLLDTGEADDFNDAH